ncbi:MAG: type IV toxin-antitoxin system AbiEi family antitoxin domain-containing protein [Acidimicrobiales bacterium]
MPGRAYNLLFEVAADQYGYVTTEDARELGLWPGHLADLARRGQADRVAQGVYRIRAVPESALDQLMEATLWPRGLGVISHDTALDLLELCDVNPVKVHVTVPASARIRRRRPPAFAVHERDLDPDDVTRVEGIPVVTVRRAILDGIERHLGGHLIDQAIDRGRRTGQLTRAQLAEIARARALAS